MRRRAPRVHHTLRDSLMIEVGDFFAKMKIFEERRPALAELQGVGVGWSLGTCRRGVAFLRVSFFHWFSQVNRLLLRGFTFNRGTSDFWSSPLALRVGTDKNGQHSSTVRTLHEAPGECQVEEARNAMAKATISGFWLILLFLAAVEADSQTVALAPDNAKPAVRRMFVDPSSASLALGKANLTVTPLTYQRQTYAGDYQLRVVPFILKSQKGKLSLAAPDDSVRRLGEGLAVEFTGEAVNAKDGKSKVVRGKITPVTKDRGTVAFSIATDNGELVFNTSYHLAP